jgi:hypothetical protein
MLFNIFIRMKLNFHKINSFFSSIHRLIIIDNAQQHRAQNKFKLCKEKLFQNCYLSSTFVLKLEPNPNLVLESKLKFLKNNYFWGEKKVWSWGFNQQFTTGFRPGYLKLELELGQISITRSRIVIFSRTRLEPDPGFHFVCVFIIEARIVDLDSVF